MYSIRYAKSAAKVLAKMPGKTARAMQAELAKMAQAPSAYRGDWKPLRGTPFWRLRKGEYRAICTVIENELLILVVKIGVRGDVYK